MPNRRDFILQACSTCAAVAGLGFLATHLDSCKTPEGAAAEVIKPEITKSQITIPVKAFDHQKTCLVKDMSLEFDVFVVKKPDNSYSAVQMRCTHRNMPIRDASGTLLCDVHGSQFDYDGNVTHAPANMPLTKYPAMVEKGNVIVKLV